MTSTKVITDELAMTTNKDFFQNMTQFVF